MVNGYVHGILDNDLYKFTMQKGVCQKYPHAYVRYNFINRDNRTFPDGFRDELKRIIETFREFALTKEDKDFLRSKCPYLSPVDRDFLSGYRFDPKEVTIEQRGSRLDCLIEGYWYKTILWEVPLMATISQLYFEKTGKTSMTRKERRERNRIKFISLRDLEALIIEFGTRRRYSLKNHDEVIGDAKELLRECLIGTSNVYLAMKHDLVPKGTTAHEWFQFHAALYGYRAANEMALKTWAEVYQGDLGIALPDTFTSEVFFRTFNSFYARLNDGLRHDSGYPFEFIAKSVNAYSDLLIDPMTKSLLFSDSINSVKKVGDIHRACKDIIRDLYGIGTWFTNDINVHPLNIVIKLVACLINDQWVDTVKLSDDSGKNTGKKEAIALCKSVLGI